MDNFETDDAVGRNKFKKDFGHLYIFQDTDKFNSTDLMMTGCSRSHPTYDLEIKNRNYSIKEICDSTFLEQIKLDAFKERFKREPDRCLIYFNYYNDGNWIAFDMTRRIKYDKGLDNQFNMDLPSTSSVEGYMKEKDIVGLCYTRSTLYERDKTNYND